jgi:hypothetical protein
MIRRLTAWIAAMTVAMLMMAVVLAGAARAQATRGDQQAMAWSADAG